MIYSASTGFPHFASPALQIRAEATAHSPALLSRVPVPDRPARDELEDWNSLLTALTARLRSAVGAPGSAPASSASAHRIQEVVLECAADLDLLHAALCAENVQRSKLESAFRDSNAAVVRAIAGVGESLHPTKSIKGEARWGKKASAFYKVFG